MKKFLITLLGVMMFLSAFSENLSFKGLQIKGNVWTFASNLQKQGIQYREALSDGRIRMYGSYLGYSNSDIYLNFVKSTEDITFIQITLSRPYSLSLDVQFNIVLEALETKYGKAEPATTFREHNSSICLDAVKWTLSDGEIFLYVQRWEGYTDVGIQLRPFETENLKYNEIIRDI